MKKNLYYQTLFRRRNILKESILSLFFALSSYPRLLLEVFIRKNFGERYFSFMSACTIMVILAIYPLFTEGAVTFRGFNNYFRFGDFLLHYFTWYVYLAGFLYMCLKRNDEVKRLPSAFDFARFSLSTGELNPQILHFKWQGKSFDIRTVETLIEPALFFFIGILLKLGGQSVGTLLITCSIFYSLSYVATYASGDNFVLDQIDSLICNEELVSSFVDGNDPSETRGVPFYGHRPADPEIRRKLADVFMGDFEEIVEAK